ncbi:MAG TPA: hypothetical protein VJV78_28310, partial [Polyangiales bacterium]|nr:hypothetical protein [Polyangiales bacterium]
MSRTSRTRPALDIGRAAALRVRSLIGPSRGSREFELPGTRAGFDQAGGSIFTQSRGELGLERGGEVFGRARRLVGQAHPGQGQASQRSVYRTGRLRADALEQRLGLRQAIGAPCSISFAQELRRDPCSGRLRSSRGGSGHVL